MTKKVTRFFTIADYLEEENWLREMHGRGWKIMKIKAPCFYTFESCEPEDVIYRLDFRNTEKPEDYLQMVSDFGWEHIGDCLGWMYFRRPADTAASEEEGELFSDNESKAEMVKNIVRTRMMPLVVIFLCSVLPNFFRILNGEYVGPWGAVFSVLFCLLFILYVYLIIHCGIKLKKMKDRYRD